MTNIYLTNYLVGNYIQLYTTQGTENIKYAKSYNINARNKIGGIGCYECSGIN